MAYILEDLSISGVPDVWAGQAITGFHKYHANLLVAEKNHGAEMVKNTLHHIDKTVTVQGSLGLAWEICPRGAHQRAL